MGLLPKKKYRIKHFSILLTKDFWSVVGINIDGIIATKNNWLTWNV